MEQVIIDFLKIYGPLGLGWVVAGFMIWQDQKRKDADIESRVKLAVALEGLGDIIKERK